LKFDQTQTIKRFDVIGLKIERAAKTFLGRIKTVRPIVRGAKFQKGVSGVGLDVGVAGELFDGRREIILIEIGATEIEARRSEAAVESEGLFVGADGEERLIVGVIGDTKVIPGLRISRQKLSGLLEFLNGLVVFAVADEAFASEQRARSGRAASGEAKCNYEKRKEQLASVAYADWKSAIQQTGNLRYR